MLKWIDKLPVKPLLVVAVFFALAPFQPEPHLFENAVSRRINAANRYIRFIYAQPADHFTGDPVN
jgi:hypothetical protein